MSTSIRVERLKLGKGPRTIHAAELHGLRQDETSQSRKISDDAPLLVGGLNLQDLYAAHVGSAKADKRTTWPVHHWLFQWPIDLMPTPEMQQRMIDISVKFANDTLGGRAVFAARLDRDEANKHVVDVFSSPLVEKFNVKTGQKSDWIQTSKHLKALCSKHEAEIRRRYPTIKDITSPRCQGIALQSEWRNHLRSLGYHIEPKQPKRRGESDWKSPEAFKAIHELNQRQEALKVAERALASSQEALQAQKQHVAEVYDAMADYAESQGIGMPPYDIRIHPDYDSPTP
jgi:hypothetical protein